MDYYDFSPEEMGGSYIKVRDDDGTWTEIYIG